MKSTDVLTQEQRINQLVYALGLAIGALEVAAVTDVKVSALKSLIERLKAVAETPVFWVSTQSVDLR